MIAKNVEEFKKIGVTPIISNYDVVEMSFDKYKMYEFLTKNNFKTPKTYVKLEDFKNDYENKKYLSQYL